MRALQIGGRLIINLDTITHVEVERDEQKAVTGARVYFVSGHQSPGPSFGVMESVGPTSPYVLALKDKEAALLVRALLRPDWAARMTQ